MYFSGNLTIDPSQVTNIENVKPRKAFKKLLYRMTQGRIADKVEHETFTAISVLQQFYSVFHSMGITNIIRISQDDIDFYIDTDGKSDDLEVAMGIYNIEMDDDVSRYFKTIYLVLEHEDQGQMFKYLVEIRINRSHEVSKYPIELKLNGLATDFEADNESRTKAQMNGVFESQAKYDAFLRKKELAFIDFMRKLEMQIKKFIPIDDIKVEHKSKIIIPKDKKKATGNNHQAAMYADDPVFHHYHGFDTIFLYMMLWSTMCHSNSIMISDTQIMSEDGSELGEIGEEGVNAADSAAFDPDQDFDQSAIEQELDGSDSVDMLADSDGGDGGWFSDFGGSDSDSGSSCSSCSSCGGCGGCS